MPMQRAPSSEIMESPLDHPEKPANGFAPQSIPENANGSAEMPDAVPHLPSDQPGVMQLLVCVLGIYASLYVLCFTRIAVDT